MSVRDFFETFFRHFGDFRARRARETPVARGRVRNFIVSNKFPRLCYNFTLQNWFSNYFLGYVISCLVAQHTMWTSDYITQLFLNQFITDYVMCFYIAELVLNQLCNHFGLNGKQIGGYLRKKAFCLRFLDFPQELFRPCGKGRKRADFGRFPGRAAKHPHLLPPPMAAGERMLPESVPGDEFQRHTSQGGIADQACL